MRLRMWSYDLAREQCPTLDHLRLFCRASLESGYNALGLYLEHRFAYRSAPWAAGKWALQPETVRTLQREFPDLQIIPMINLLGHMEGFLYTEQGCGFAEERFKGMQACPSNEEFVQFAHGLLEDTLHAFKSEIIHIGGDETQQLGCCSNCAARVRKAEGADESGSSQGPVDGKAVLYAEHFAPMAQHVLASGRRPAVWGDMFLEHQQALEAMPKETLIFDWQYFGGCADTCKQFIDARHEVVCCPTLHTYNAAWFHVLQSEENVRRCIEDADSLGAYGVCLTTWECGLFGAYDTLLPAVRATGEVLKEPQSSLRGGSIPLSGINDLLLSFDTDDSAFLRAFSDEQERYDIWARIVGSDFQNCGPIFQFSGTRSSLKCRFLLYSNPFLLWLHHHEELCGKGGDQALELLEQALKIAPNEAAKGVTIFVRSAIEFARIVEDAHQDYAAGKSESAITKLVLTRQIFENLTKIAKNTHERIGGSLADIERCRTGKEHVEKVIVRIRHYGDGQLGYVPSFEMLTHPKFVPHDQAGWWLINKWANE